MGIPNFYGRWIVQHSRNPMNKAQVILRQVPSNVLSFSIDMNGMIHTVAQKTFAYGEYADARRVAVLQRMNPQQLELDFFNNITNELLKVVTEVQPRELLVIAVDGVAPRAKINQQRSRRFRSAQSPERSPIFDSNAITPGTELMMRLDAYLENWLLLNQQQLPPRILYSSHLAPGEGEHKIMDFIRAGQYPDGMGAHLLYGLDADLVMLAMLAPIDRVYLVRENLRDIISIDGFKDMVKMQMGQTPSAISDFVLLSFFIGNDFLPHSPTLEDLENSFDELLRIYREAQIYPLTDGLDIVWENLRAFIAIVADYEPTMLVTEAQRSVKYPSRFLQEALTKRSRFTQRNIGQVEQTLVSNVSFDYEKFRDLWYSNELGAKGDTSIAAKWGFDISPITIERITDMVEKYLTGLGWIFRYYQQNWRGVNNEWYYPYYHTPLFGDMSDYLQALDAVRLQGYLPVGQPEAYSPIHQLLAVLPLSSVDLVPPEVQHLMSETSIIIDQYPQTFIVELEGKNKEHEGVAIIPFADMDRIVEAVNNYSTFSQDRADMFMEKETAEIALTPDQRELLVGQQARRRFVESNRPSRGAPRGSFRGGSRGAPRGPSRENRSGPAREERSYQPREGSTRGSSRGSSRGAPRPSYGRDNTGVESRRPSRGGLANRPPERSTEGSTAWRSRSVFQL